MLNSIDKSAVEIKNEFKNEFSSNISPKIKQFNKKRFVLAIEGIVSLIIPAAMAYIFFVMQHPQTQKDMISAISTIVICGSILPIISLYYYFCPESIKTADLAAASKHTGELEEQVLSLFRIKRSNYISKLKQNQLIEKLKETMIFPKFDRVTRFNARITLGGMFVLKNANDIGTKYESTRNSCKITIRENSFYNIKTNDYYMVLLLGGFALLVCTTCMAQKISQEMIWFGYALSIALLGAYIIMIFVNSSDQYKGVTIEIETPDKIYDGHAVLLPSDIKSTKIVKKPLRAFRSPINTYNLFISKTNPPNALTPVFFSILENIKKTFKTKSVRVSIKDNSIILFIKTHNKRLNVFDWTKDMESSKAYEPFINRWLSVFNMADNLSKKS